MSTTNPYAPVKTTDTAKTVKTDNIVEDTTSSVPSGTVSEVLAWVDNDPERALEALEVEQDNGKRKSLIATLENIIG